MLTAGLSAGPQPAWPASTAPAPGDDAAGPLPALRQRRAAQGLTADAAQDAAAAALQQLHDALAGSAPRVQRPRLLRFLAPRPSALAIPRGVYLHGPVGRGKTMLMDLFFAGAPVAARRRVHFSAFMLEVHDRLHGLRRAMAAGGDAVPALAAALAAEARLLCLDELQIDNIADAMLVARLFEAILAAGTVVVATSNWAPDDLYAGGLQRDRVLPFIALIRRRFAIVPLDGGVDYRRARLAGMQVYHWPLGPQAEQALERDFATLTEGLCAAPVNLEVQGRTLHAARAARDVAWLSFSALCGEPRGAADYLALAQRFAVVAVPGIPLLTNERRDEARRFTLLLDVLYEAGVKLLCSAAAPPDRLFDIARDAVVTARAVSRLLEMQSAAYLARTVAQENDDSARRSLALAVERE